MPDYSIGIYDFRLRTHDMRTRRKPKAPTVGDMMTAQEMTEYALRNKLRNTWGIMDAHEIKQTISSASDNWRLELIKLSAFSHIADATYCNPSMKAHPIVLRLDDDSHGERHYDVLDGRFRIAMAKARGDSFILAWVGQR